MVAIHLREMFMAMLMENLHQYVILHGISMMPMLFVINLGLVKQLIHLPNRTLEKLTQNLL